MPTVSLDSRHYNDGHHHIYEAFHRVLPFTDSMNFIWTWHSEPLLMCKWGLEMSCLAELLLCSLTCSNRQASAAEFAVFHIMTRILEATNTLFLPLPPGKSWLFVVVVINLFCLLDFGTL